MSIGSMRYRLEIQSPTRTSDQGGGSTIAWTKVATVYADIVEKKSDETTFADKLRDKLDSVVRIRYRRDVTTANRLVQIYRRDGVQTTRTFTIKGVLNVENRFKFLELDVEEGVAV